MLRRALTYLLAFPAFVVLITLAVINHHPVRLVLPAARKHTVTMCKKLRHTAGRAPTAARRGEAPHDASVNPLI